MAELTLTFPTLKGQDVLMMATPSPLAWSDMEDFAWGAHDSPPSKGAWNSISAWVDGHQMSVPESCISFGGGGGLGQKDEGRAWGQLGMVPPRMWESQQTSAEQVPRSVLGSCRGDFSLVILCFHKICQLARRKALVPPEDLLPSTIPQGIKHFSTRPDSRQLWAPPQCSLAPGSMALKTGGKQNFPLQPIRPPNQLISQSRKQINPN